MLTLPVYRRAGRNIIGRLGESIYSERNRNKKRVRRLNSQWSGRFRAKRSGVAHRRDGHRRERQVQVSLRR